VSAEVGFGWRGVGWGRGFEGGGVEDGGLRIWAAAGAGAEMGTAMSQAMVILVWRTWTNSLLKWGVE
jgi:hypothetical protein